MTTRLLRGGLKADLGFFGPFVLLIFAWFALGACGDSPTGVLPAGFNEATGDEGNCDYLGRPRSLLQKRVSDDQSCVNKYTNEVAACQGRVTRPEEFDARHNCDRSRLRTLQSQARSRGSYDSKDPLYAELDRLDDACHRASNDYRYDNCNAANIESRRHTAAVCQQRLDGERQELNAFDACVQQKQQARAAASQPTGGVSPGVILLTPGLLGGFSGGQRQSRPPPRQAPMGHHGKQH
jgi:hypothetical protein